STSHNLLYKSQISSFQQVRYFFSTKFIGLLLEQWKFIVIAMLLFLLGGLASFLSIVDDPLHLYSIMPGDMAAGVDPERLGEGHEDIDSSLMAVEIMTNNIEVAILACASGITLGMLIVYVLVYSGIVGGSIAADCCHARVYCE